VIPDADLRFRIEQLQLAYAAAIDQDRLEDLPGFFEEACEYRIVSRENAMLDLPMSLFQCSNRNMLRDRVVSLRHANVFNAHFCRHVLGPTQYLESKPGEYRTMTSYALYQTTPAGQTSLFSVGHYEDRVAVDAEGTPLFRSKVVNVDTFSIPTFLSIPI